MGNVQGHLTSVSRAHNLDGRSYKAEFEHEPFNEGSSRLAFRGVLHGRGHHKDTSCVVKLLKKSHKDVAITWEQTMLVHNEAQALAELFNKRIVTNRPIEFSGPTVAKVDRCARRTILGITLREYNDIVMPSDFISFEKFIEGDYKKYNSNTGFDSHESDALPAFSHFTYEASGGQLVVCDLQGVRRSDKYELTDPAICSRGQCYGPTDLGAAGIGRFFDKHECNKFCKYFRLPQQKKRIQLYMPRRMSSTYTNELSPDLARINSEFSNSSVLPTFYEDSDYE